MRTIPPRFGTDRSSAARGPPPTVTGTVLFLALIVGSLIVVSYPATSIGVAALAVGVRYGVTTLARRRPLPTTDDPICMPRLGVCLGA